MGREMLPGPNGLKMLSRPKRDFPVWWRTGEAGYPRDRGVEVAQYTRISSRVRRTSEGARLQ
jgi:hypothetical protein